MVSRFETNLPIYPLQPVMEDYKYRIPPINHHDRSFYNSRYSNRSGRNSGRFSSRHINSGRSGFSEDLTEITEPSSDSEERNRRFDHSRRPSFPIHNISIPSGPMMLLTYDNGHPYADKINRLHFPDLPMNQNNNNHRSVVQINQKASEPTELNFDAFKAFEDHKIDQNNESSVDCELLPIEYILNYLKLTGKLTKKTYKFPTDNINNKINRFVSNNLIFLPKSSAEVTIENDTVNQTIQSTQETLPISSNYQHFVTDDPRSITSNHFKSPRVSARYKNAASTQVSVEFTEKSAQNSEKSDKYHIYNGYMITPDEIRPINDRLKESKAINTDPILIKDVSQIKDNDTNHESSILDDNLSGKPVTSDQYRRSKSPTIFYPKRVPILPPDLLDDIRFDEEKTKKRFLSMKSITEKDWINLKSVDLDEDDLLAIDNTNQAREPHIMQEEQHSELHNDPDRLTKEIMLNIPEKKSGADGDIWNTLRKMDEKIRSMEQLGDSIDNRFKNSRKITLESQKSKSMFNINQHQTRQYSPGRKNYRNNHQHHSPEHPYIHQHDLLHRHNHPSRSRSAGYIPAIFRENSRQREMREQYNTELRKDSARQMAEDVLTKEQDRQPDQLRNHVVQKQLNPYDKTMQYIMNEQKRKQEKQNKNDTARSRKSIHNNTGRSRTSEPQKSIIRKIKYIPYSEKVRLQRPEATRNYKPAQKPKSYADQLQQLQPMHGNNTVVVLRESTSSINQPSTNRMTERTENSKSHGMPAHIKRIVYGDEALSENCYDETMSINSSNYLNWDEIDELTNFRQS